MIPYGYEGRGGVQKVLIEKLRDWGVKFFAIPAPPLHNKPYRKIARMKLIADIYLLTPP